MDIMFPLVNRPRRLSLSLDSFFEKGDHLWHNVEIEVTSPWTRRRSKTLSSADFPSDGADFPSDDGSLYQRLNGCGHKMESVKDWVLNKCKVVLNEDKNGVEHMGKTHPFVTPQNIPEFRIPRQTEHRLSVEQYCDDVSASSGSVPCSPMRTPAQSPPGSPDNGGLFGLGRFIKSAPVSPMNLPKKCFGDDHAYSVEEVVHPGTNADPHSSAAMSVSHFKTQTSYGFETLTQNPHTRRKESLFHPEDDVTSSSYTPSFFRRSTRRKGNATTNRDDAKITANMLSVDAAADYFDGVDTSVFKRDQRRGSRRRNLSNVVSPLAMLTPMGDPAAANPSPRLVRSHSSCSSTRSSPERRKSFRNRAKSDPRNDAIIVDTSSHKRTSSVPRTSEQKPSNILLEVRCDFMSECSSNENSPNIRRSSRVSSNSLDASLKRNLQCYDAELTPSHSQSSGLSSSCSCQSLNRIMNPCAEFGEVKFSLQYSQKNKHLRVLLIRAENLAVGNRSDRAINAYAKVCLMPGKLQKQSSNVIKHTRDPVYDEEFYFHGINLDELRNMRLKIKIFNKCRNLRGHELIGETQASLGSFDLTRECRMWKNLERKGDSDELGYLQVSLSFEPKSERLSVMIIQAMNLPKHNLRGAPDPYVKLELIQPGRHVNKTKRQTVIKKKSTNPIFNTSFTFIVSPRVEDINYTTINLTVCGHERIRHDDQIGMVKLGYGATEETELHHWSRVIQNPEKEFTETHKIMEME